MVLPSTRFDDAALGWNASLEDDVDARAGSTVRDRQTSGHCFDEPMGERQAEPVQRTGTVRRAEVVGRFDTAGKSVSVVRDGDGHGVVGDVVVDAHFAGTVVECVVEQHVDCVLQH